ncbi:MAG: 2-oxo-4-hydroxy-4-carboxy-5-ureidoimidazoline decarboxylase [Saprospiraceae bacterium]|nr:2-oxo-4-hydroxy-4-carboxy-5-ureidoimidazoline decarboxylase [Saprospiraceae bacterium]
MDLQTLNQKETPSVHEALFQCCGSTRWVNQLISFFPFASELDLVKKATDIWYNHCTEADYREAFTHHPKIGDVKSLREKFASTQHLAGKEQAGVQTASTATIERLAQANSEYEAKNGFIFIVCATGKSADEMLRLLEERLQNTPEEELAIAMGEQHKITIIRLKKLLTEGDWSNLPVSQITTHVLDTSIGKTGQNMSIRLQTFKNNQWQTLAQGVTNKDGRIGDLLPACRNLPPDHYRMVFDTGNYYKNLTIRTFYPSVDISFTVFDDTHYHVPLLVNPFGYSTYRGS